MSGPPNPKNSPGGAAASDLGLGGSDPDMEDEDEKKRKLLQQQRERMGQTGTSVYGLASMSLFGDAPSM